MKTLLRLTLAFLFITAPFSPSRAEERVTVRAKEAAQYIGQNVTVEGVVTAVTTSRKGNTFINFGGAYPNQTFTGWIPAGTQLAGDASLQLLEGKTIRISGTIELYRGKPEIEILSKDQIASE